MNIEINPLYVRLIECNFPELTHVANKEYSVDLAKGATTMFITALPKEDSTTAAFEM